MWPAAATAADAVAAVDADAAASSSSSSSGPHGQETWEEEIEETLKLVCLLPPSVRGVLEAHPRLHELLEVVMDLGRPPMARFPGHDEALAEAAVTQQDLDYATQQVGEFGGDNRAGIDATLHRISCLRNRAGRIVGLTCRVGRAIHGSAGLVADLIAGGASVLFMGRPGVGKTTAIRELSRLMADDLARRVVIVDTSNEIGGDGDVPHTGIGRARRMQVPDPEQQHRIMIEAVENHMPQVVVIDEIGTEMECSAARTIAQRGVQLVATAHGNELQNLVKNPALSDLIGGIQSVTLGDDEAKRRGVQKSILERAAPPTFDVAVEMLERNKWHVYADVAAAVDALLAGQNPGGQMRERAADGSILKYTHSRGGAASPASRTNSSSSSGARVLPDLRRPGAAAAAAAAGVLVGEGVDAEAAAAAAAAAGGFVRPRLFVAEGQQEPGPATVTRRGRAVRLGLAGPEGALLRLHASDLDEERLWEVMSAMGLHDKVYLAPRPSESDAVLAIRSRLKTNATLRATAREAGVPVYAIKSSSSSNLVRAFRTLLGLEPSAGSLFGSRGGSMDDDADSSSWPGSAAAAADAAAGGAAVPIRGPDDWPYGDGADEEQPSSSSSSSRGGGGAARALVEEEEGLEEARLAAEQIVTPLQQPVELLPRAEHVRRAQAALCGRYGLAFEVVGSGSQARVRMLPAAQRPTHPGGSGKAAAAAEEAGGAVPLEVEWSESCNWRSTSNTPLTNKCQLSQTPGIMAALQQLEGDALSHFSPCELHEYLKGRTLWVIGDSMMRNIYYALRCFMTDFWDHSVGECAASPNTALLKEIFQAADTNQTSVMGHHAITDMPGCVHLLAGGRICWVNSVRGEEFAASTPGEPSLLQLLQGKAARKRDIFFINFGRWHFNNCAGLQLDTYRRSLRQLAAFYKA
ncbi:hypothetical protein OEZ86_013151 [Tetradesmus obliquus]|nr:hypothetical protein OEZ86_013151 [Tetradesmus obliquus]